MPRKQEDLELRSEGIKNIVGKEPGGIIRYGIGILTVVLFGLTLAVLASPWPGHLRTEAAMRRMDDRGNKWEALIPYRFCSSVREGSAASVWIEGGSLSDRHVRGATVMEIDHTAVTIGKEAFFRVVLVMDTQGQNLSVWDEETDGEVSFSLSDRSVWEYLRGEKVVRE